MTGGNAPETNSDNYKNTQIGLGLTENNNEDFSWSKDQINKFLPETFRT